MKKGTRSYRRYIDPQGEPGFEVRKAKAIHALREGYRREYINGRSDESFLLWLETELKEAEEREENQPEKDTPNDTQ